MPRRSAAIQKTFGYWLFDWGSPHNPFRYLNYLGTWRNWSNFWVDQSLNSPGDPVLSKGIYFASSQPGKSPLNPRGQNNMSVLFLGQFVDLP